MLNKVCSPVLIYLVFSLIQIVIDIGKKETNKATAKFVIMSLFSILLNILCERGLTVISWLIVFIPFISMTIITTLLLYTFDLYDRDEQLYVNNSQLNQMNSDSVIIYDKKGQDPNSHFGLTPEEVNHYNKETPISMGTSVSKLTEKVTSNLTDVLNECYKKCDPTNESCYTNCRSGKTDTMINKCKDMCATLQTGPERASCENGCNLSMSLF